MTVVGEGVETPGQPAQLQGSATGPSAPVQGTIAATRCMSQNDESEPMA